MKKKHLKQSFNSEFGNSNTIDLEYNTTFETLDITIDFEAVTLDVSEIIKLKDFLNDCIESIK